MDRVLFVEAGNTSLKAMIIDAGALLTFDELFSVPYVKIKHGKKLDRASFERFKPALLSLSTEDLSSCFSGKTFPVCFFSSVAVEIEDSLITFLSENLCDRVFCMRDVLKREKLRVAQKWRSSMGVDRLLSIEFLYRMGYDDFLVASFGTATVLDVVSGGRHRAGFIMPGFESSAQALIQISPVLRERFRTDAAPNFSPSDTSEAMLSGIVLPCVSFIEKLFEIYALKKLFMTGGALRFFVETADKVFKEPPVVLEELTLRAMAYFSGTVRIKLP